MLAGTRRRSGKTDEEKEAEKAEAEKAEAEKAEAEKAEAVVRLPAITTTPPVVAWAPIRAAKDLPRVRDMP